MERYPSEIELKAIREWSLKKENDYFDLAEFIISIWNYEDYIRWISKRKLLLSTGGWSGNEDIISALQDTMFWVVCWQESKRGGHYKFKIPNLTNT